MVGGVKKKKARFKAVEALPADYQSTPINGL